MARAGPSSAQGPGLELGGQAIPVAEWADATPAGHSLAEIRVIQPAAHLHGSAGHLRLVGMVNLEGLAIPNGQLAIGNWGEGFVDRRHPHTYLHELVLSADDLLGAHDGAGRLSVSVGKGFAPFGTDDPMMRGFLQFPVNHHLAQILERAVAIAAFAGGPVTAEAGLFNGDEPEHPGQGPNMERFGDSWSARLTGGVRAGLTAQVSAAHVHSPEHRPGAGPDQEKWSASARWDAPVAGRPLYALLEWAHTSEAGGFFVFRSLLAEGALTLGLHRLQYRFERSDRPEEERISAFRSLRPHLENSILGTTRWTVHTLGYRLVAWRRGVLMLEPQLEVSHAGVALIGGGLVDLNALYGGNEIWSLAAGLRISAGALMHRMGRYGAAAQPGPTQEGQDTMPEMTHQ